MSGDTSQWFSLPGGPVGFAIGAEYRREKLFYTADPFVSSGASPSITPLPTFSPSPFFGEGGLWRNPDPDPRPYALLRDAQASAARRGWPTIIAASGHGLGL